MTKDVPRYIKERVEKLGKAEWSKNTVDMFQGDSHRLCERCIRCKTIEMIRKKEIVNGGMRKLGSWCGLLLQNKAEDTNCHERIRVGIEMEKKDIETERVNQNILKQFQHEDKGRLAIRISSPEEDGTRGRGKGEIK